MLKAVVASIVLSLACLTSTSNADEPRRGSRDIVKRATHPPRRRQYSKPYVKRMYYQQTFSHWNRSGAVQHRIRMRLLRERYQPLYYQPQYFGIYRDCYPQDGFNYRYRSVPGIYFGFSF